MIIRSGGEYARPDRFTGRGPWRVSGRWVGCVAGALIFAARQFGNHGVCRSSWCLLFVHSLFGARVPQLVARQPVLRVATHALGEQTPLLVSSTAILSRHRYHDNEVSTSFLSDLRPSSRSEAMVLASLDLGALALWIMRHTFAIRFPPAIDARIVCRVIVRFDDGGCGVVLDVPHFSVDLGISSTCHLHRGDDFYRCSW